MPSPRSYALEIREILKAHPLGISATIDSIELLPLQHIDTALSAIQCARLRQQLSDFRATYLTEDIKNLSMRLLNERCGNPFLENLISSLKALVKSY